MSQDVVIARASGVKLVEREGLILVVDQRTGWVGTAGFVAGLLTFILAVNAIIQLVFVLSSQGGHLGAALILLVLAGAGGAALVALLRLSRRRAEASPEQLGVSLCFDLRAGTLNDGRGQVLAPLAQVSLQRKFQLASSAPALVAVFPGGSGLIVRGNPFAGGIAAIEQALRGKGIRMGS